MNKIVSHAIARKAEKAGLLDVRGGMKLLRDRNIRISLKLVALAIGIVVTFAFVAMEIPLEGIVAFLLPVLGGVLDFAVDGIEFVLLPLIVAALVIPHLSRREQSTAQIIRSQ